LFRVELEGNKEDNLEENKKEILAYLSGKMRMHRIKVLIGDVVEIVLDPYGGKGRIVKRL
jgi:translation initiation factor IF-1